MGIRQFARAIGFTGLLILVGTPQSFAGEDRLSGAQITEQFSGARIYARARFGEYLVDYKPNGEMVGANRQGNTATWLMVGTKTVLDSTTVPKR